MNTNVLKFENIFYDVRNNILASNNSSKIESREKSSTVNSSAVRDEYIRLLNGLSGQFESRKLSAIMGPSGHGKTSLLDVISGNLQKDSKTSGRILYNGQERIESEWINKCDYMPSEMNLCKDMTVFEYIRFSAMCKCKYGNDEVIDGVIDEIINDLSLHEIRDTRIGKISGGEFMIMSVIAELVVNKEIIILDEPTTGLDSHRAFEVVEYLKSHAVKYNRIIIMTLHHPGPGLFSLIDNLYFIINGDFVYEGTVDNLTNFFEQEGLVKPEKLSKPEFLFEIFSDKTHYEEVHISQKKGKDISYRKKLEGEMKEKYMTNGNYFRAFISPSIRQFVELYKRGIIMGFRNSSNNHSHSTLLTCMFLVFFLIIFLLVPVIKFTMVFDILPNIGMLEKVVKFAGIIKEKCPEIYKPICKILIHRTFIEFNILCSIYCPIYIKPDLLLLEFTKGTYSPYIFYLAFSCIELTFELIKLLLILPVFGVFKLHVGLLDINILIYIVFSTIFAKLSFITFYILIKHRLTTAILSLFKLFLAIGVSGEFMSIETLPNYLKISIDILCLFFWNNKSLDDYLWKYNIQSLYNVIGTPEENSITLPSRNLQNRISLSDEGTEQYHKEIVHYIMHLVINRSVNFYINTRVNISMLILGPLCTIIMGTIFTYIFLLPKIRTRL